MTQVQRLQRSGARLQTRKAVASMNSAINCGIAAEETFRPETKAEWNAKFAYYRDKAKAQARESAHFAFMAHPELRA